MFTTQAGRCSALCMGWRPIPILPPFCDRSAFYHNFPNKPSFLFLFYRKPHFYQQNSPIFHHFTLTLVDFSPLLRSAFVSQTFFSQIFSSLPKHQCEAERRQKGSRREAEGRQNGLTTFLTPSIFPSHSHAFLSADGLLAVC